MQRLINLLHTHLYAISLVLALTLAALWITTDGFAFVGQGVATIQARLRENSADILGQVWCTTSFTNATGQTVLGHYPGMSAEEVVKFHADAAWLLRDDSIERETLCYRTWQAAFEAATLDAPASAPMSEKAYKDAVLSFYLGGDAATAAPAKVAGNAATPAPAKGWCYSEIKTRDNLVVTVPHPPGGRQSIEAVLNGLEDRSQLTEYIVRATICFESWAEAADYITGGEVELAEDATQEEYETAMETWQKARR